MHGVSRRVVLDPVSCSFSLPFSSGGIGNGVSEPSPFELQRTPAARR